MRLIVVVDFLISVTEVCTTKNVRQVATDFRSCISCCRRFSQAHNDIATDFPNCCQHSFCTHLIIGTIFPNCRDRRFWWWTSGDLRPRPGRADPQRASKKEYPEIGDGPGQRGRGGLAPLTFFQCSDDGMPAPRCSLCAPRRLGAIGVVRTRWNGRVEAGATGRLWRR